MISYIDSRTKQIKTLKTKHSSDNGFAHLELLVVIAVIIAILGVGYFVYKDHGGEHSIQLSSSTKTANPEISSSGSQANVLRTPPVIPLAVNPVNPALIPLGDGKISTTPKAGYVDTCTTNTSGGGSQVEGPWIDNANSTWNSLTKTAVEGSVNWAAAYYSATLSGNTRMISTNDLPINHPTGSFPISKSDPAYAYDTNPNKIVAQPTMWDLPANPVAAASPSCTNGGPVGILTDGVFLFNALDGEDRDAGAHEVLDDWQGHPDSADMYHHHSIPIFMLNMADNKSGSTLVGYAIDGYGIYIERDANGNLLTDANLDACHGRTSEVMWNGKMTDIYHYDATLEYPYTVGCFHGTPIKTDISMSMAGPAKQTPPPRSPLKP
jgi:hypothetical protein